MKPIFIIILIIGATLAFSFWLNWESKTEAVNGPSNQGIEYIPSLSPEMLDLDYNNNVEGKG